VIGKGSKQRTIPLPDILADHLHHYLRVVRPTLSNAPLLFTNPYGQQPGQPLTRRALLDLCRRLGSSTGIPGPHTALRWRHT
jgi:site-specific recombinase XerD